MTADGSNPTPCAECWHAVTFRRGDETRVRCTERLWVDADVSPAALNAGRVRRWFLTCPRFDGSEHETAAS